MAERVHRIQNRENDDENHEREEPAEGELARINSSQPTHGLERSTQDEAEAEAEAETSRVSGNECSQKEHESCVQKPAPAKPKVVRLPA